MPKMSRTKPTADEIAAMASRGEDISAYFTNKFTVVKPVRPANDNQNVAPSGANRKAADEAKDQTGDR